MPLLAVLGLKPLPPKTAPQSPPPPDAELARLEPTLPDIFARLDPIVADKRAGDSPPGVIGGLLDNYKNSKALYQQGRQDGDAAAMLRGAKGIAKSDEIYTRESKQLIEAWKLDVPPARKLLASLRGAKYDGVDVGALTTALDNANAALGRAITEQWLGPAAQAFTALRSEVATARKAAAQSIVGLGDETPKAKRSRAAQLLKGDPDVLKTVAALPGGKAAIDAMVGDVGDKAKTEEDKAFVAAAVTARYGPKLIGDLTSKYLPKLYKALGMVPDSHTKENPKLQTINRTRTSKLPQGDYLNGRINLEVDRTGMADTIISLGANLFKNVIKGKDISQFDVLTLHEVGHSVDDARSFMAGKLGNNTFGGWLTHQVDEVADAVGTGKGFYADFATLPRAFLKEYLKAVLEKRKPQEDAAVTGAAPAQGDAPPWKKLAGHAAVKTAEAIRLKSADDGLWERGDSGASKHAIGGSVFQESYEGQWVSYSLAARAQRISNYQFRAEGEWFAEAYAAFFVGKLKDGHPLSPMLKADQDAQKAADKAKKA